MRPPPGPIPPTLLHILITLADGVRHGYAIKQEIERRTEGALRPGPARLYESIQRLVRWEYIAWTSQPLEQKETRLNRRYYRITDEGLAALRDELDRLERLVVHARSRARLKGETT
jgi:DNA-binding PadR family transcriptional regulator